MICFGIPEWWTRWLGENQRVALPAEAPDGLATIDPELMTELFVLGGLRSTVVRLRPSIAALFVPALEASLAQLQGELPVGIEVDFDREERGAALKRTA